MNPYKYLGFIVAPIALIFGAFGIIAMTGNSNSDSDSDSEDS